MTRCLIIYNFEALNFLCYKIKRRVLQIEYIIIILYWFWSLQKVSKSMYDYVAADDDEVSFREDDLIIQCEPIDDGWMMGTVESSGQHGMLPSNYVERLNWWD